jgi:hypothetical protein
MTIQDFEPGDGRQEQFIRYGPAPIPDERDGLVGAFVSQVVAGDPAALAKLGAGPSVRGQQVLLAYAERMASLAVRRHDQGILVLAVDALLIGGLDDGDREALMVLPLIEDSARRLDAALEEVFRSAGPLAGRRGAVLLKEWLGRAPEDRTLECMGFREGADADGFRYVFDA